MDCSPGVTEVAARTEQCTGARSNTVVPSRRRIADTIDSSTGGDALRLSQPADVDPEVNCSMPSHIIVTTCSRTPALVALTPDARALAGRVAGAGTSPDRDAKARCDVPFRFAASVHSRTAAVDGICPQR